MWNVNPFFYEILWIGVEWCIESDYNVVII